MHTMMLPYISYNRANKDFAKENRCPMTRAEKKFGSEYLGKGQNDISSLGKK